MSSLGSGAGESGALAGYWRWAWLAVGAVVFLSYGYTEMAGSDLWWHLAAGREMLESRREVLERREEVGL